MFKTRVTGHYRSAITAVLLLMVASLTACKADTNYFSASNSSIGSGDGSTADINGGFQVTMKPKTGVSGFMHKFGDTTASCTIAAVNKDTPTSIQCMLNVMEYDLWFHGFEYQVTVPKDFCSFIQETPYRYYKGEAGSGPSSATISTLDGAITGCSIGGAPPISFTTSQCVGAEATFTAQGAATCAYDYSRDTESPGPNCCAGKLTLTRNVSVTVTSGDPPVTSVQTTTSVTESDYGGTRDACTESPMDEIALWPKWIQTTKSADLITSLNGAAFSRSQKIPSVFSLSETRSPGHSNFFNAGFHDWATYVANPSTWVTNRTIPRAMTPLFDKGNTGAHSGANATSIAPASDGSYMFSCLGPAGELRHRISLYVNEWNTIEDYEAFKAAGDAGSVSPTRTGLAGQDCSAVNLGNSCNTMWGWDDMLMDTTYPLPLSGNGDRAAYAFPYEGTRFYLPPP